MLVEAKSNLARLMASENLIVEQRKVQTASFDLKNRILTVPILDGKLSAELYDLLLGHEVGHALETPEKGWHDSIIDLKVNKSILNVCEDARIEKKIKRKFPGIRVSFLKGYKELLDMDFFGIKGKNIDEFNFIDRVNLHTKCGAAQVIKFTKKEQALLKEVENTETFDEVVTIARKIQEYMKIEFAEEQAKNKKLKITIKQGQDEEGEGLEQQEINLDDYDEIEIVHDDTPAEVSDEKSDEEGEESSHQASDVKAAGKEGYFDSKTDTSFRKKEENLHSTNAKDVVYTNIPESVKLDDIVVPYKKLYDLIKDEQRVNPAYYNMPAMKRNYINFCKESNKVVSYLVKEFELRKNADQMVRAKVSKTGELNMSKLQDYKFTDDIFKRMTKVPNGKSHGLVMFMDWSGSMIDHMHSTIKQLLNLTLFCKKVNIPFEVYAFSSNSKNVIVNPSRWRYYDDYDVQTPVVGDLYIKPFSLLHLLSNKMSSVELTEAACFLLDFCTGPARGNSAQNYSVPGFFRLSGTPLNEAIVTAFHLVPQFKTDNKLEIVNTVFLTDGEGGLMGERYSYKTASAYKKESKVLPGGSYRTVIRDKKTKACIELKGDYNNFASCQTISLLKLLKQRLQCNLIGFYICSTRDAKDVVRRNVSRHEVVEKHMQQFKTNNYTYIEDCGYDEQYILRSEALDTNDSEFDPQTNTVKGLVSSFTKHTSNKIHSRVVLNRFIGLIA